MLYVRGNKADYDDWEKKGAKGWNYEEVLPYFNKAETIVDEKLSKSRKYYLYNCHILFLDHLLPDTHYVPSRPYIQG
jgi:choline dehydrogenase-like flavoprotein